MKCTYCGAELREGVPFCGACGRPVSDAPKKEKKRGLIRRSELPEDLPLEPEALAAEPEPDLPPEEKKPKKKRRWKLILILSLIAALLIGAAYLYITMPAFKLQRAINKGTAKSYQAAAEIYTADVQGSFVQRLFANMLCKDDISAPAEAYFAGDLTYKEAKAFYTAFSADKNKTMKRASEKQLKLVEADHDARKSLAAGDTAMEDEVYLAAMEAYAKVPEGTAVYADAQKKLKDARKAYVTSICDGVDKLIGQGKADEAMTALNSALEVLPDNKTLTEKRATVGAMFEAVTLDKVSDLVKDKDYTAAKDALNAALELMPESQKLSDKLEEVEKAAKKAKKD